MINFACACGKNLRVGDESAGKRVKCPGCGNVTVVPAAVPSAALDQETAALSGLASPAPLPSGVLDDETAALSRLLAPEAAVERPGDEATCEFNSSNTPAGLGLLDDTHVIDRADSPSAEGTYQTWSLGGYRILRELGQGGMGAVYEAEDVKLERCVSLKVMKPEVAKDPQNRERFLREAQTAASVESVYICPIYEVGEDNGVPFIAMPFLKGEPLNARWKKGQRLPIGVVVRIGREVAEGLSAAHEAGLVHRDIKPANIWLETQPSGPPRAIILDFGLARVQADNAQITRSGVIVGTPAYMSPEQARGNKNVDARTDLFSLGCVLYALSTGELPFQGKAMMDVLLALATHDPAPPHTLAASIPPSLSNLILRLLAKNPDDRPRAARAVIDDLVQIEKEIGKSAPAAAATRIKPAATFGGKPSPISTDEDRTEVVLLEAAPDPVPRKRSYAIYTLVAVGLLGCVTALAGGGVYHVVTDKGTIEIRTEDEKVQVHLLKNGQEIEILDGASKKTWSIRTGKYTVRLKDDPDDLEIVMPDTFEFKRGDTQIVTIRKLKLSLAQRFPAVLQGKYKFANDAERLEFAQFAHDQKKFAFAAGLWEKALASDPKLGDDRQTQQRYKAARAAVLAAAGQGKDEPPLDDAARAKLRGQALDWLKAELTAWSKHRTSGAPQAGVAIAMAVSAWQKDPALAGVRDPESLGRLPKVEQAEWQTHWAKAVALRKEFFTSLPAAEQVEEVRAELTKRNPGFDGKLTHKNADGVVTELTINGKNVTDLAPLRALAGLKAVSYSDGPLSDLSPLEGMKLTSLSLTVCPRLKDLGPLKGMKLTALDLAGCTQVQDLSPLKGMPLTSLHCHMCAQIRDLTPLAGMPLTNLNLHDGPKVVDLSPLKGMKLTDLALGGNLVRDLSPLKGMPITMLGLSHCREFQDLAQLKGLPITMLYLDDTQVRDLEPLKGIPLKKLYIDTPGVTDITPLKSIPLEDVRLTPKNITKGLDILRAMTGLKTIGLSHYQAWPAAEFWARYDKGEFEK